MKIAVITTGDKPTSKSSVMREAAVLLAEKGAAVDMLNPDEQALDLENIRVAYDLYILKSSSQSAISLAGLLHLAGASLLNPYTVVAMMKDKVLATGILLRAGVPLPETFMASRADQLGGLLAGGPLVVKPYWGGSQGRGVRIVEKAEDLNDAGADQGLVFAQRYHKPDGRDHKIYCIGDQIFGVMRVWPARTYEDKLGEPFEVSPEMSEIARRCGRAFGIDLYGLDIIVSDGRPYVVDINTFPGFKGVPDAARHLADYIHAAAVRASTRKDRDLKSSIEVKE
jgi:ribosomal protein S6--L-glutamate ligase